MFTIIPTKRFLQDVKYYVKRKRFVNIGQDISRIVKDLEEGNFIGDEISNLKMDSEGHTFKVRVANSDTKVGKSNGYRVIYYAIKDDREIYLLTIYYKKEDRKVPTNNEIIELVKKYCI